jgi:hypothetical protein
VHSRRVRRPASTTPACDDRGVPAGLLLAAAFLSGASPVEAPVRPGLASYDVTESSRSITPAGESGRAWTGTVRVAGGRARWELSHGTFPRSSAAVAIADGPVVTLLDVKERVSASATLADFAALFQGRPAAEGSTAFTVRDVSVRLDPDGKGRAFQGRPTARYALEAGWTLVVSTPGRVARVTTEVKGAVETLEEPAARSAFDGLGRLIPARGEAADALDVELAKLPGLPVSAVLDVVSRFSAEAAGMPSATAPPSRPVETRQTITRRVSNLAARPGVASDDALFAIPDDFHTRGLDRIVPEEAP